MKYFKPQEDEWILAHSLTHYENETIERESMHRNSNRMGTDENVMKRK